eukprot:7666753-Heterocapsa_arctica.AAC.1
MGLTLSPVSRQHTTLPNRSAALQLLHGSQQLTKPQPQPSRVPLQEMPGVGEHSLQPAESA